MVLTKDKKIEFAGFSRPETKRSLQNYYNAAEYLWYEFSCFLHSVSAAHYDSVDIVMEAPFDGSYASSGLWMLQAGLLKSIHGFKLANPDTKIRFFSLAPSYISGQIKKVCNKKDGIGVRKDWCNKVVAQLSTEGYRCTNPESLKAPGCDRQTAFGFWYFLSHSDKQLEEFQFE